MSVLHTQCDESPGPAGGRSREALTHLEQLVDD